METTLLTDQQNNSRVHRLIFFTLLVAAGVVTLFANVLAILTVLSE